MKIEDVAKSSPEFDFREYFLGRTKASGWFTDRFGNIRKHFCGEFVGSYQGDSFILDEQLNYTDGIVEKRVWIVSIDDDGNFRATSDSLEGDAVGLFKGNTLNLRYAMHVDVAGGKKWLLSMNDWMFYQADGSLHNITEVSKWGLRIGTVSTQYQRLSSDPHVNKLSSPADGCAAVSAASGL